MMSSPLLRWCAILALGTITCACSAPRNVRTVTAPPDPQAQARTLLNQGNYLGAAAAFEALAASGGPQATHQRAVAALLYQDAGDYARADALLAELEGEAAEDPVAAVAKARSMANAGLFEDAYAIAAGVRGRALTPYQRGALQRGLGQAALQTRRYPEAAAALIDTQRYPIPADSRAQVLRESWQALSRMPRPQLEGLAQSADRDSRPWYELALAAATSIADKAAFAAQLEAWQTAHPGHPAEGLLEYLHEQSEALAIRPRHIGVLLPFDDALRSAAIAVRDGLMTAWYEDRNPANRPVISVYAIDELGLDGAVSAALADGVDFIIGPLRKPQVAELRADSDIDVSVLALNVADDKQATRVNFYQFGLTPENEAEQVARRAFASGKRALILAPESAWGARLAAAYAGAWTAAGGEIVEETAFADRSDGFSAAVKTALNIDLSEARSTALKRRLGLYLHDEARRRADIDVILLAGFPQHARQVMPQLRYFGAETVPVFATSHVFGGRVDTEHDIDLDGITFGDMPWLFGAADRRSFDLVQRHWTSSAASYARLYALGIDAYRLVPYLGNMRFQPGLRVPGVTGALSMNGQGVIERDMVWLRFVNGEPRLLDGVPTTR